VDPLRIGLVGCGAIAQIMHLPFLSELPQFRVEALSDLSAETMEQLARRYGVLKTYRDYGDLLQDADVDAVAVLTRDHAPVATAAASAGKHLFVEKPLCWEPAEGRRLLDAVTANGVTLQVGYMRRYDPAYGRMLADVDAMGPIRFLRLRDYLGGRSVPTDVYTRVQATDFQPPDSRADRAAVSERLTLAVGEAHAAHVDFFWMLLMLASHDLALLRPLVGRPERVLVTHVVGEMRLVSTLEYAEGVHAVVEFGVWPQHAWFDARLDVYGDETIVSVELSNPWVKYAPSIVTRRRVVDGGPVEEFGPVSYREAFRDEWVAFHDCVTNRREPLANGRDALDDVELAAEIVRAIPLD
jgi:predicted dehydrogenase